MIEPFRLTLQTLQEEIACFARIVEKSCDTRFVGGAE